MSKTSRYSFICMFCLIAMQSVAQTKIVTTIKPLHSIIENIVEGEIEVDLLLDKNIDPHDYLITPSKMITIKQATLLVYIDDSFEAFVSPVVESFSAPPAQLKLLELEGLKRLAYRKRGHWRTHKTTDHGHDIGIDPHIWLDPENAQLIATAIAQTLGQMMPDQAQEFIDNASVFNQKLVALNKQISNKLEPVSHAPFVVFHDSYQYFEKAFSLHASASMTLVPNEFASIEQINHIAQLISDEKIQCIFTEPQYNSRLVNTITKDVKIKQRMLDPLGIELTKGRRLIFDLYSNMAATIKDCLTSY